MSQTWVLLGIIALLGVIEIFADIALADWAYAFKAGGKTYWGLAAGIAVYAVVGIIYGLSLLFGKLAIANTLWQVLSIILVFFIGVYMFKETPTVGQWIGLLVITLGLVFMLTGEDAIWKKPNRGFWHHKWSPFPIKETTTAVTRQ